jgi:hypothetical protein
MLKKFKSEILKGRHHFGYLDEEGSVNHRTKLEVK